MDWETRYVISELEGLADVFSLTYFKWMIQGCDITVVTDHSTLIHLLDRKVPKSNCMFHWRLQIEDFKCLGGSLKFVYKPDSAQKVPDTLSRNLLLLDLVPSELTETDWKRWAAAVVLVELENTQCTNTVSLASTVLVDKDKTETTEQQIPTTRNGVLFHMPDVKSIVSCVRKWQDTDDYCQAALAYLDKG